MFTNDFQIQPTFEQLNITYNEQLRISKQIYYSTFMNVWIKLIQQIDREEKRNNFSNIQKRLFKYLILHDLAESILTYHYMYQNDIEVFDWYSIFKIDVWLNKYNKYKIEIVQILKIYGIDLLNKTITLN